jgi:hypothetical protein
LLGRQLAAQQREANTSGIPADAADSVHVIRWYEVVAATGPVALLATLDPTVQRFTQKHRSPALDDAAAVFRKEGEPSYWATLGVGLLGIGLVIRNPGSHHVNLGRAFLDRACGNGLEARRTRTTAYPLSTTALPSGARYCCEKRSVSVAASHRITRSMGISLRSLRLGSSRFQPSSIAARPVSSFPSVMNRVSSI